MTGDGVLGGNGMVAMDRAVWPSVARCTCCLAPERILICVINVLPVEATSLAASEMVRATDWMSN
jgi:hypothetical protein